MKMLLTLLGFLVPVIISAQSPGLYNGTESLAGNELKTTLHEIIKNHHCLSYYFSKFILRESDADPAVPGNVILVYTGRSQNGLDYGTLGNQLQREHVWAKSHGNFNEVLPMFSDVHNLKPADASVNSSRSNLDFDNGGFTHPEATGCKYDDDSWEPRNEVKGDIARIIFYMDTRYEGGTGEIDLTLKDAVNTYPNPWHGKLSALLQWNEQDPPDAFERNRNNVIASYQGNRNPFIDNPDFARLIWGNGQPPSTLISEIAAHPVRPLASDEVIVTCVIKNTGTIETVKLLWGNEFDYLENELIMQKDAAIYQAAIPPQSSGASVYFAIQTMNRNETAKSVVYRYTILNEYTGRLISISEIQGTGPDTPYYGQTVTTTGIVTANNKYGYFIQDKTGPRNGLCISDPGRKPKIGDSVVVTGIAKEYFGLTEIQHLTNYVLVTQNVNLPEPSVINASQTDEDYEGVLIRVSNAVCTFAKPWENDDMWVVNDGTGDLKVRNSDFFELNPALNETYTITGTLTYDNQEWKVELRRLQDVMNPVGIWDSPEMARLEIFPNPTTDNVTIKLPENISTGVNFTLYDLMGKIRLTEAMQSTDSYLIINLDDSGLKTGMYYLVLEADNYRAMTKVMVRN